MARGRTLRTDHTTVMRDPRVGIWLPLSGLGRDAPGGGTQAVPRRAEKEMDATRARCNLCERIICSQALYRLVAAAGREGFSSC